MLLSATRLTASDLVNLLVENPNMIIEICGHTGLGHRDKRLSQQRAQVVCDYLIEKGIEASRVVPKGYGNTRPVTRTYSEDYKNRRVEFKILSN